MNYIFLIIIFFFSIVMLHNLYELIKLHYDLKTSTENFEQGILNLDDFSFLKEEEFNNWCINYFDYLGFSKTKDINLIPNAFVCERQDNEIILLTCKYLDKSIVSKIAGLMYSHNLEKGLIISTDSLNDELKSFVKTFSPKLVINIIDGKELIREIRKLRKKELEYSEYFS